jgi:16S rRNA (adenine1518-N6/adenine1519-N6)-dimethyltransferase
LSETRDLLREYGLRPRKGLGQNFLTDARVVERIVAAAELAPNDTVIEVGPGLGVLTMRLAAALPAGRLRAVELDRELAPRLTARLKDYPHAEVVEGNILELNPAELSGGQPYKVVANLPYYITSAALRHFLSGPTPPTQLVVMVQREVAARMTAAPGEMSLLALAVQFYGAAQIMFSVPPAAFYPPPKVHSAVVRIDVYAPEQRPLPGIDDATFFRIVRAGFGQKRKQLVNTLSGGLGLDKASVGAALTQAGIAPGARPEELGLAEWGRVVRALSGMV